MSWMFLYVIVVGLPWRMSILCHMCNSRCDPNNDVGVDFYNRPSEFNFFHFPRSARWWINGFLMANLVAQVVQSTLYIYPWNTVYEYMTQPNGTILLITGPVQGIVFGGAAAGVQMYHESKLHVAEPERFPPTVYNTCVEIARLRREGTSWSDIWKSLRENK